MTARVPLGVAHGLAGVLAFLLILTFWTSTLAVELFGGPAAVAAVKSAIAWSLLAFVPLVALTGITGFAISRPNAGGPIGRKARRMRIVAANGVLVLVPAALILAWRADAGQFDSTFVTVQAVELVTGALNATLIALNVREGLRLSGRWPAVPTPPSTS
jgi:hypothetical protein